MLQKKVKLQTKQRSQMIEEVKKCKMISQIKKWLAGNSISKALIC